MSSPYDHVSRARDELSKAQARYQNLRTNPAYQKLFEHFAALEAATAHEREMLFAGYRNHVGRRLLKVLRQYMRLITDRERAEEKYRTLDCSSALEVPKQDFSGVYQPSFAISDKNADVEDGTPHITSQRGCAHWECEGGERCEKPVFMLEKGRPSPYCEEHLSVCQNPRCPYGPNYRIPARFKFCSRCRSRSPQPQRRSR